MNLSCFDLYQLGTHEFLNIDAVIENALHKIIIKPLKKHLYKLFVQEYKRLVYIKLIQEYKLFS